MKNTACAFFAFIMLLSCGKNDDITSSLDGECVGIIDTAPPGIFYIELVDSIGNNLIENGFYDRTKITTKLNGDEFDYQTLRSNENSDLENLLVVSTIGNEGDNRWLLTLSETDVDTLDFKMSNEMIRHLSDGSLFCGDRFILNSASYSGANIVFEESKVDTFLKIPITVVKTMD